MLSRRLSVYLILLMVGLVFAQVACSSSPALEEEGRDADSTGITPLDDLEEWDLLWISDSSGWGVAEIYAGMVSEDTGKKVNVHDNWIGGLPANDIYLVLTGKYEGPSMNVQRIPEYVAEAELIVFYGNPEGSINSDRPGDWNCTSGKAYADDCDPEIFSVYVEQIESIYERMLELRENQPTIIRAYDAYNPLIDQFREAGVYEDCKECWANYNAAIHQAADNMNIPIAGVSLLWNGPAWDLDPDSDLSYTKDGIHPNEMGAEVIAQALRELGYDPVPSQ